MKFQDFIEAAQMSYGLREISTGKIWKHHTMTREECNKRNLTIRDVDFEWTLHEPTHKAKQ